MGSGGEVNAATELTVERVQQTLLGVLIYLVISNLVYPISARNLALWSLTESLSQVQTSMRDTLGAFSSFVHDEALRYKNRKLRKPSLPIADPIDTTAPLLRASSTLGTYSEVLLDAASEPALWRVPFPPIGLRYAELAAGAQRASNAIRLVHHCLKALHAQAVLVEQKFDQATAASNNSRAETPPNTLQAPLLRRLPQPSTRNLALISSLSESYDTATHSGRGFQSFEPLSMYSLVLLQSLHVLTSCFLVQ